MKTYTVHLHEWKAPVLVPERFSWGGFLFGPLWLLLRGSWIAAILSGAILFAAYIVPPPELRPLLAFGVMVLLGLLGNDLRRWHLGLRQFEVGGVVAARTWDQAMFRLLAYRPELVGFSV